jgi:hypothetical protein
MGSAKTPAKKRTTTRRVNMSQPSEILKQKQLQRVRALLAEKRRQEQMRREFELFLTQSSFNNNNNNWYFPGDDHKRKRKTRKLRR